MSETEQPSDTPPVSRFSGLLAPLIGNIWSGCRLALFRPVRATDFRTDANSFVQALLALATVNFLLPYAAAFPNPEFELYGVGTLATALVATVAAIWILALARRASRSLASLLVILVSATVFSDTIVFSVHVAVQHFVSPSGRIVAAWSAVAVGGCWVFLIALRAQRIVLGPGSWRGPAASALYLSVLLAPAFTLPQIPLWQPHLDDDTVAGAAPERRYVDAERVFYDQPELLAGALDAVARHRPGVTDLYFLGFAGYGPQDVFRKEVAAAVELFDSRFDTRDRSMMLVNNAATVDRTPVASVTNLRLALAGMARKMDPDEDVLFLFLTSHGSPSELAVQFWPLPLNNLLADDLRGALDDAGIRWRVVVVSACYSGSFIDALRDPGTLVITAARKDRTSFGCSDDADFTYFGRALVDQALRETYSFTDAFARAYSSVSERETAEHNTPSEPQIFIGETISAKLAEIETRLRAQDRVAAQH